MTQPLFREIVQTQHMVLPASSGHPLFDLTNLNQLLGSYPGADGVKTGTTPAAGQNLVGSSTQHGRRLMTVVYGSTDRYADARNILDTAFRDFAWFSTDEFFPTGWPLVVRKSGDIILSSWEASQIQAMLDADSSVAHFTLFGAEIIDAPIEQQP